MSWAPDYTTSAALKRRLKIDDVDTTDDADIALAITAASRAIDRFCNRQFGRTSSLEERSYTAQYNYRRGRYVVFLDDLMPPVTGAVVEGSAGTITDYVLEPVNAVSEGRPYTQLSVGPTSSVQPTCDENDIVVTAPWGWTSVPAAVEMACLIQAHRFFNRKDSPYGIEGSPDSESGGELRILSRLDADVMISLKNYVRPRRLF